MFDRSKYEDKSIDKARRALAETEAQHRKSEADCAERQHTLDEMEAAAVAA